VVMVVVDCVRCCLLLRLSGCTWVLFIRRRRNLTTWNGAWC
jgi:hypothetical protein